MADAEPLTLLTAPLPVSDYSDFEDQQQQPETETGQQQRALHLHRLRFVNHLPAAITSLSLCPSSFSLKTLCPWISSSIHLTCSQLAAIGRANGDIQLFTTRDRKFLWSIPASVLPGAPIENITWSHRSILTPDEADLFPANEPDERQAYLHKLRRHLPRLFSTSGSQVIEYDWIAARPTVKKRLQLPGGAICDMVLDPQHGRYLAACTESGQIHVIDITESDQMEHLRSIDCPGAGKLLSLAWREKAKGWVTGGADSTVRKWDLNGKQAGQFNVAKKKSHTLVWALLVLS